MSEIQENILSICNTLSAGIRLVAVSKTKPVSDILEAYRAGQRIFGENRVQELMSKKDMLPDDIEWHLIGHLQTNKVKYIVPFVSLIHSVDTFKLLKTIDSEAKKVDRTVNCLLQFHIAKEETKFGFSLEEAEEMLSSAEYNTLKNIRLCGVMGIATFTDDTEEVRHEFKELVSCFNLLKDKYFSSDEAFREKSMGMSDDYMIAIEEGSTMVRVGSKIFGKRI